MHPLYMSQGVGPLHKMRRRSCTCGAVVQHVSTFRRVRHHDVDRDGTTRMCQHGRCFHTKEERRWSQRRPGAPRGGCGARSPGTGHRTRGGHGEGRVQGLGVEGAVKCVEVDVGQVVEGRNLPQEVSCPERTGSNAARKRKERAWFTNDLSAQFRSIAVWG